MSQDTPEATEQDLGHLADKVSDLIALCDRLRLENEALREQRGSLAEERAVLLEKNELARTRVEAMISRLKAMESVG
ncbi:MAG: TIGR02449 family protein [Pseudomonadota bacterium]